MSVGTYLRVGKTDASTVRIRTKRIGPTGKGYERTELLHLAFSKKADSSSTCGKTRSILSGTL